MPQTSNASTPTGDGIPPIVVRDVSKTFRVPEERTHTLKERALHPLRRTRHETFEALRNISFEVRPGEFFGIVGRNGSGKSTLLKCLAGIYRTDVGQIWCNGRMSTFIELGVGFNPDLAAYDNVALNGIMLGLSPSEARARYQRVIEFAELEEFQDLKLKNYSSGMHVRLAFSVAIQVDADILLIDEVLAVGDAAFQQKCFDVFNRMRDEGRTIVFVTHDMGAVTRFCHRAMLLERGNVVTIGDPRDVADRYLEINFGREPQDVTKSLNAVHSDEEDLDEARGGDGQARILEAWAQDEQGQRTTALPQGRRATISALVEFRADVNDPAISLQILNDDHDAVVVASSALEHERSGQFRAGEHALFSFSFDNVLAPRRYSSLFTLAHRGTGLDLMDRVDDAFSFVVTGPVALGGIVDLPVEVDVDRSPADIAQAVTL